MPSSTTKQARFMSAAAHNADFAHRAGIPVKVAKEFHAADKGHKYGKGHHEKIHAALSTARKYNKKADGGEVDDNLSPEDQAAMMPETYANPAVRGAISGVADMVKVPGQVMTPNPYPPGSEEADWFEDQRTKGGEQWAHNMALNMMGGSGVVPAGANELRTGASISSKGFTKAGAEIAPQIHDTVLGASAIPQELHPAANVLAKDLKSFYPKDIAQSAYYLGVSPSEIENNLKSYMSPGAIDAFDKHYVKLASKAKAAPTVDTPYGKAYDADKIVEQAPDDWYTVHHEPEPSPPPKQKVGISAQQFNADNKLYDPHEDWSGYDNLHDEFAKQPLHLNPQEQSAVNYWGQPSGYKDINGYLRGVHNNSSAAMLSVKHLDTAMSPLPQDTIAWRGLHGPHAEALKGLQPGETFYNAGYTATTIDPRRATHYGMKDDPGIILNYHLPEGHPALYTSHPDAGGWSQNERELLLPHGAPFKLIGKENIKAPVWDYNGNVTSATPRNFTVYHVEPWNGLTEGSTQLDAVAGKTPPFHQPAPAYDPAKPLTDAPTWMDQVMDQLKAPPSKADDFASALKKAIYSKFEDHGGPWKEVAKGPGAKDLVKHLHEDSTHGTIVNALAQQHIMDSPIPTWGIEGQKLQGILNKTEPDKLVKSMSNFYMDDNHVENILSHLPEDKIDAIKQYMAGPLKQQGYEVPGASAKTDQEILQDSLTPVNWMEYKPQRGKLPDQINWGQNDPEKLKELGVNPNVILYKGGNLPAGEYPEQIFDPLKDKPHSDEPAFFAADAPHVAKNYGTLGGHYVARPSKVFEVDYTKLAKQLGHPIDPESGTAPYGGLVAKILKEAKQHNPDLVIMHNMHDYGGPQTQYAFMNTSVLRAPHAAFDPTKLHLRYPLAGLAGGGLFAYGMANDESQAGHMADGGKVKHKQIDEDPQEHEFIDFSRGGLLKSEVPGRTDKIPLKVKAGAFVLPADIPSALGQGNTSAGADILKKMFQGGPYGMEAPHIHGQQFHFPSHFSMQMPHSKHAAGGKVEEEPVKKSKAKVDYREANTASRRCGTCKYAYGPTGQRHCWLVEGMIKPDDVCNLWEQGIAKKAEGGSVEHVPIIAAGGEFIVSPEMVKEIGHGDIIKGHRVLSKFVLHVRKEHIKTLRSLKPPK